MASSSSRDERGAVLVVVVLLMAVLLTFTAFAVDLGTQRVARRDMQSLADAAAMDLARQIKGRTVQQIEVTDGTKWRRIKDQAIEQNGGTVGRPPQLTVALGDVNPATGKFSAVSGNAVPTAVNVIASTSVAYSFAPGDGGATASAIATAGDPTLCFSVSPTALALDTSSGRLGPLLDSILRLKLKVANPNGLLDVTGIEVPLADIAVTLGAVTPQALLNKTNVSLRDFVLASATALRKNGYAVEADVLKAIALDISGVYVNVGKILKLDTTSSAGLAAGINVFDIVTAAIFAANGTNSVDVKGLSLDVPGIGGVQDLSVTITEPPQIACGKAGATAKSAQIKVHLKSRVDPLAIGATDVLLDLGVDLGRGEGTLTSITCDSPNRAVINAKSGLASVYGPSSPDNLGLLTLNVADWRKLPLLGSVLSSLKFLLGDSVLSAKVQIGATAGQGGPTDLTFSAPARNESIPSQSVSAASNVLNLQLKGTTVSLLNGSLLGSLLGWLIDPLVDAVIEGVVQPLVNGPVNSLLSTLLYPVFDALGVKVGQTDVSVHGNIDCTNVQLVG